MRRAQVDCIDRISTIRRARHPAWRRCSSVTDTQSALSSRLTRRAPRSGAWYRFSRYKPLVIAAVVTTVGWMLPETVIRMGTVEGAITQVRPYPDQEAYRFEEIAADVHFAIGTGSMTVMSNALVIINDDHVMLVDTSVSPAAATALVEQVENQLTDKPIRYVFNSHYHFDHAHGNQIFGDDVEIVGHEWVRQMHLSNVLDQRTNRSFSEVIPGQIEWLKAQIDVATDPTERARLQTDLRVREAHWNAIQEVEPTPPNVTYTDVMTIHKGGREVQLHHLGRGHTGGDTIVFLPAERIAFTGDFFVGSPGAGGLAYMGDGFIDEWPTSLERLKGLDFDLIVPGHGRPFREREQIANFQRYLRDFWTQVSELRAQGLTVEDAVGRVDLSAHEQHYGRRVRNVDPRAVARAYELLQIRMPM